MGSWNDTERSPDRGLLVFGTLLVVIGIVFLVAQVAGADVSGAGWPLYVIVPGVALLLLGLAIGNEGGLGAAIPGGIITAVGLVLAVQNATQDYATWSYMWALVAPGAVGVTLFLYGLIHRRPDLVEGGLRTAAVGAVLFIAFGLFFENVVNMGVEGHSTVMADALPVLAIVLGAIIVLVNLFAPRPKRPWSDGAATTSDRWTADGARPPAGDTPAPPPADVASSQR